MHSIYKQGNLPYLAVKSCPQCEQLLPLNVESCPNCNYNFTSKTLTQTLIRVKKSNQEVTNEVLKYQNTKEVKEEVKQEVKETKVEKCVFCDNCGAKIIGTQRYCGGCGVRVSKRICPSCEQIVDSNLTFCPLCGERLNENKSNVQPAEETVTNQVVQPVTQPQGFNAQPINIFLNPNNATATVNEQVEEVSQEDQPQHLEQEQSQEEVVLTQQEETQEEKQEETSVQEEIKVASINMGRKRLFLIIQMLLVGVIAAIMVMVPILTEETFFNALIPCVKGSSSETLVTGKNMYAYVVQMITDKTIYLNSYAVIYPQIINADGQAIFTSMPFMSKVFSFISKNPEGLEVTVSVVVVLVTYALLVLSLLISFLSGFFGLFIKKPYRGKTLGFVLFTLVLASLLIYSSTFFNAFKGYDSWLLYALALVFFVWFIVKLVFTKEAKQYKAAKEEEKLRKEIESE